MTAAGGGVDTFSTIIGTLGELGCSDKSITGSTRIRATIPDSLSLFSEPSSTGFTGLTLVWEDDKATGLAFRLQDGSTGSWHGASSGSHSTLLRCPSGMLITGLSGWAGTTQNSGFFVSYEIYKVGLTCGYGELLLLFAVQTHRNNACVLAKVTDPELWRALGCLVGQGLLCCQGGIALNGMALATQGGGRYSSMTLTFACLCVCVCMCMPGCTSPVVLGQQVCPNALTPSGSSCLGAKCGILDATFSATCRLGAWTSTSACPSECYNNKLTY